jgi:hypothetical protein
MWKAKAMTLDISLMPMRVLIDSQGNLILADDQLAAVIVRLDGEHHDPQHKGWWCLEAGFGKCNTRDAPLFRRHRQLKELRYVPPWTIGSASRRNAGDVGPGREGLGPSLSMISGVGVSRTAEEVCYLIVN